MKEIKAYHLCNGVSVSICDRFDYMHCIPTETALTFVTLVLYFLSILGCVPLNKIFITYTQLSLFIPYGFAGV